MKKKTTNFLNNLTKKFDGDTTEDEEINKILIPIKKRINMDGDIEEATFKSFIKKRINMTGDIKEATFISFLKQKIGIEEIKEDKFKNEEKIEEEVCCSCCDCWENKKNQEVEVEVEESQHEIEE